MSTWRALATSDKQKTDSFEDDDWETDGNFEVWYFRFLESKE